MMGMFDFFKKKKEKKGKNEKNIVDVINTLPDLLPLNPATNSQIADAESKLKLQFAKEYKDYLIAFGSIMAQGIELTGIAKAEYINVVAVTKQLRELNPQVPHNFYVVEDSGVDGILIWQDSQGFIYQTRPNVEPKKVAESLVEYILSRTK